MNDVAYMKDQFLQMLGAETPTEAADIWKSNHHLP